MKKPRGILRLVKIVIKEALLAAELPYLPPLYPGQRGAVGNQGVSKAGICAALVEQRSGVVVHLDRGEAAQAICLR